MTADELLRYEPLIFTYDPEDAKALLFALAKLVTTPNKPEPPAPTQQPLF